MSHSASIVGQPKTVTATGNLLATRNAVGSAMNFLAMRIGPGKHLQGRSLMGGVVTPEAYDHFYEVLIHLRCVVHPSCVAHIGLFPT